MVRLFVALDPPDPVREQLSSICAGLQGARWVPKHNLHLTLRFVGEVDNADSTDIDDALSRLSGTALEVSLEGLGFFGKGRKLRSLWIRAARSPELVSLRAAVESVLVRSGCAPETRNFFPHITLAYLKGAHAESVENFVADHSMFRIKAFPVTILTLYSSFLSRSGAIYTPESQYSLEAA